MPRNPACRKARDNPLSPMSCASCGTTDSPRLRWQTLADGRLAIRAECAACRRWIKFVAQTAETIAEADASTPHGESTPPSPVAPHRPQLRIWRSPEEAVRA